MNEDTIHDDVIHRIQESWSHAKPLLLANPEILDSGAPGVNIEQLNEALETVCNWARKTRAPSGFKPIYPIVRLQLATALSGLAAQAASFAADPAAHFQAFVARLVQCFPPLSAAVLFSEKASTEMDLSLLTADLHETLALIQTAQIELANKTEVVAKAQATIQMIEDRAKATDGFYQKVEALAEKINAIEKDSDTAWAGITATQDQAKTLKGDFEGLAKQANTLVEALDSQRSIFDNFVADFNNKLEASHKKATASQELIDSLLNGATSSALATAFNRGKKRFIFGQVLWGLGFVAAVCVLASFGFNIHESLPSDKPTGEVWLYLVQRLPLVAPLV